jgi:hypothetical protein
MPSREELEEKRSRLLAALSETDAQLAELKEEEAEAAPPPPPPVDDDDDDAATRPPSTKTLRRQETDSPAASRAASPMPPPEMAPVAAPPQPNLVAPVPVRPPPPPRTALPPAAVVPRPGPCPLQFGSTGKEMREFVASTKDMTLDGPDPYGKDPYACWENSPTFRRLRERLAKAEAASNAAVAPFGRCVVCAAETRVDGDLVDGALCCFGVVCQKEYCEECSDGAMADANGLYTCDKCPTNVLEPWMAEIYKPDDMPRLFARVDLSDALKAQVMSDEPDLKVLGRLLAQELRWLRPPKRFDPKNPVHLSLFLERMRTWDHAGWRRLGVECVGASEWRVRAFCQKRLELVHPGLVERLKRHDDDCKEAAKAAAGKPPDRCVFCRLRDKVVAEASAKVKASKKRGRRPSSKEVATLAAEALSVLLPLATSVDDLAAVDDEVKEVETEPGEGALIPDHLKYWPLIRLIDGEPCWACDFCNRKVSFIFCTFPHDVALEVFKRAITWACTSLATQTTASAAAS